MCLCVRPCERTYVHMHTTSFIHVSYVHIKKCIVENNYFIIIHYSFSKIACLEKAVFALPAEAAKLVGYRYLSEYVRHSYYRC